MTSPAPDTSAQGTSSAWRSLRLVLTVQTQNAFNDNVVRFTLMGIAFIILKNNQAALDSYKNLIGTLISLPFVLFAPIAGWTSDRFSKRNVIQACLYAQLVIIGAIMGAILLNNLWLATAGFFVLAIQSAFFGPAKIGIMKELVGGSKLALVSGWMQMLTIVAIVFGSPAGGGGYKAARSYLTDDPWLAGLIPIGFIAIFAVVALVVVRRIQPTPSHHQEKLTARVFFCHFADLREIYRSRPVWLSAIGIAFFWFSGAYAIAVFTQIAQEQYDGDTAAAVASYCLAATGVGIALGSAFVAFLSTNRIELGLVPLGAIGMGAAMLLATAFSPGPAFYGALALLGAASATFLVPQNAFLQDRADPKRRGRVISASNLINSLAAIAANGAQLALQKAGVSANLQLWMLGGLCLMAALYSLRLLPSFNAIRVLLKLALRLIYRFRVLGEHHLPHSGGALLLSNHVTWIDGLLIGAASPRDVRFVAYEGFFKKGIVGWGLRLFGVIPISAKSARHAIKTTADAIKEGHLVCLFPEGTLTRTGQLNELQKGFELIARQSGGAPVIPVYLDNLWGSVFSFSENKFFFKRPRQLPYPATVNFGAPVPPREAKQGHIRSALLGLGLEAFRTRPELQDTLARASLHALKKQKARPALTSRSRDGASTLSRHQVLVSATMLGQRWRSELPDAKVAIALPPSSAGFLAHLGLMFAGKTIINIDLQAAPALRDAQLGKLRDENVHTIITTKAFHQAYPSAPWPKHVVDLTQALRALQTPSRLWHACLLRCLPLAWTRRRLELRSGNPSAPALGFFDSEGNLQYLTHCQVLTQAAQVGDASALRAGDALLNLYPYASPIGQFFGLWMPVLHHCTAVHRSLSSNAPDPQAMLSQEQVAVLVSDLAQAETWLPSARSASHTSSPHPNQALRLLITFDAWPNGGATPPAEAMPPFVGHALLSPDSGTLVSLSLPHPEAEGVDQAGHRAGAYGRPLPGAILSCTGTPETPQPVYGEFPGDPTPGSRALGWSGYLDDDGFLFVDLGSTP